MRMRDFITVIHSIDLCVYRILLQYMAASILQIRMYNSIV